jgi:hypothetical protein
VQWLTPASGQTPARSVTGAVLAAVFEVDATIVAPLLRAVMHVDRADVESDALVRARLGGVGLRTFNGLLALLHAAKSVVDAAQFERLFDDADDDANTNNVSTYGVLEAALAHPDSNVVYVAVDTLGQAKGGVAASNGISKRDLELTKRLLLLNVKADSTALRQHFAARITQAIKQLHHVTMRSMRRSDATNPAADDDESLALRRQAALDVARLVDFLNWMLSALVAALYVVVILACFCN